MHTRPKQIYIQTQNLARLSITIRQNKIYQYMYVYLLAKIAYVVWVEIEVSIEWLTRNTCRAISQVAKHKLSHESISEINKTKNKP